MSLHWAERRKYESHLPEEKADIQVTNEGVKINGELTTDARVKKPTPMDFIATTSSNQREIAATVFHHSDKIESLHSTFKAVVTRVIPVGRKAILSQDACERVGKGARRSRKCASVRATQAPTRATP